MYTTKGKTKIYLETKILWKNSKRIHTKLDRVFERRVALTNARIKT